MISQWSYTYASVIGSSHVKDGSPCQDSCLCKLLTGPDGHEVLVAVVSDGAGSAERSAEGSALACNLFVDEISALLECGGNVEAVDRQFVCDWLLRFRSEIDARCNDEDTIPRSFACTFLAAIVHDTGAVFIQKGDGAIVVSDRESDGYCWVFWPQSGEYENVTYFITDEATDDKLEHEIRTKPIDKLAVFSDGLQRLALHYGDRTAHAPFFEPMFAPLEAEHVGYSEDLSRKLKIFLSSQRVNERSDDDRSLLLAARTQASELTESNNTACQVEQ